MADLRSELLAIREKRGTLTKENVVEEATDPNHPLHSHFNWDDTDAAHQWRLHQAMRLLRVTFRVSFEGRSESIRAFHVMKVGDNPKNQYVPIEEVAADPVAQRMVLQRMIREWQALRHRYEKNAEFFAVIQEHWPEDWPPLIMPEAPANGTEA